MNRAIVLLLISIATWSSAIGTSFESGSPVWYQVNIVRKGYICNRRKCQVKVGGRTRNPGNLQRIATASALKEFTNSVTKTIHEVHLDRQRIRRQSGREIRQLLAMVHGRFAGNVNGDGEILVFCDDGLRDCA